MGVECFAINVNGWDSNYQFHTNLLWDAANSWNNAHPNNKFYLYPSVDMASISSEATFEAISRHKYNDPARLRVDGGVHGNNLPVTQTWLGNNVSMPSGWNRILNEEDNAGCPVFFMPYFNGGHIVYGRRLQRCEQHQSLRRYDRRTVQLRWSSSGDNSEAGHQKNQSLVLGGHSRHGCSGRLCARTSTGIATLDSTATGS